MPAKKSNQNNDTDSKADGVTSKQSQSVNDVAKPGETAATPTSRPIITGHGEMIKQDPMVSGTADPDSSVDEKNQGELKKKSELRLKPTGTKDEPADESSEETKPLKAEDREAKKPDTGQENDDDSKQSDSNAAAIDSLASSATGKKLSAKQTEEEQKRSEKIRQLIENRTYNLPITEGGHKASSERFISWLLLILLIVAAGVYLAIDAGYLNIGVALPHDFIKE
ncbi:MAG TPA: hypothetical protein VFX86_04465 [Candidatus Saccharimonadales bacterium]|nr:hypothetical protein [Candidatus Saccharimonadales bacterium]